MRKDCQHELVTSHKRSLLPFFQLSLQQNSNDYSTTSQKFPNAAQRLHDLEADDAAKRDQLYQKSADLVLLVSRLSEEMHLQDIFRRAARK